MTQTQNDEAQIRKLIDRWADAMRSKNAAGVISSHADNSIQFTLAPPLISSASGAVGLEGWFRTWTKAIGYDIHELTLMISGDLALSASLNHLTGPRTDGTSSDVWFRQTLAFRRIDGAWKIVHEHDSVPFYMDGSYKAAIDLKPQS